MATCNSISLNAQLFSISDNLWTFLNRISVREHAPDTTDFQAKVKIIRWFWIDPICIDQSKRNERNHQVKIMGDIYASADRVLVWLGESVASPHGVVYKRYTSDINDEDIKEISQCRYWSRLWVIQEIMLGNEVTVLFGSLAGTWPKLRAMIQRMGVPVAAIVQRKYIPSVMTNKYALHRVLELFAMHEWKDPRDKIYGLIGIVHKEERIDVGLVG